MKMNTGLNYMLLGRWLDSEFDAKTLARVNAESFKTIKEQMYDIFEEAELNDTDIKAAWKEWFDWAVSNGTLINHELALGSEYAELQVNKLLLAEAYKQIDMLESTEDTIDEVQQILDYNQYLASLGITAKTEVQQILDFRQYLASLDITAKTTEEEIDKFYDMKWTIGFGDRVVTLSNDAHAYYTLLEALDNYIQNCL